MSRCRQAGRQSPVGDRRQQGAVLLLVTFSLVLIFGIAAFVLDLGRMYIVRSQLQNAADAGALRGAKELVKEQENFGTPNLAQVTSIAKQGALTNARLLGATALSEGQIEVDFAADPYPTAWGGASACGGSASGCHFVRVRTSASGIASYFAEIIGIPANAASALAVAGQSTLDVTPLGVCAIMPQASPTSGNPDNREYGFIRGVAYNIPQLNPLSVNADPMWINPVDLPPGPCTTAHSSTSYMVPFVCSGKGVAPKQLPGSVYVNTGSQAALEKALNSRFDDYQGNSCDPAVAPPDPNIREFAFATAGAGYPKAWMDPGSLPTGQYVDMNQYDSKGKVLYSSQQTRAQLASGALAFSAWRGALQSSPDRWGVLWSYNREIRPVTGSAYALTDWSDAGGEHLYGATDGSIVPSGYPGTTPYSAYVTPPGHDSAANRRRLNVLIINCDAGVVGGPQLNCKELPVIAVGRFFMQTKANLPGTLDGEFAGLVKTPVSYPEIRLYQ